MTTTIDVEVVSDVVCPWCFLGEHRLDQALERWRAAHPDASVRVHFSPFLLDPTVPDEGVDLRERLAAKYRVEPAAMFDRVEQAAASSGLVIDFEKVRIYPSTLRAHTLLRAAEPRGTQLALARALFRANFQEGLDVGDVEVLARLGQEHGFTADEVRAVVTDAGELDATRAAIRFQSQRGVTGVPFFVFQGRYAVSGAQSVEVFGTVLDRVLEAETRDGNTPSDASPPR